MKEFNLILYLVKCLCLMYYNLYISNIFSYIKHALIIFFISYIAICYFIIPFIDSFNSLTDLDSLSLFHLKIKLFFKFIAYKNVAYKCKLFRNILVIFFRKPYNGNYSNISIKGFLCKVTQRFFNDTRYELIKVRIIEDGIRKLDPSFVSYVSTKFYEKSVFGKVK